jgi:hypothetical protein
MKIKKTFINYKHYADYLLKQEGVDDKILDDLLNKGLLKRINTLSKDGYTVIGFSPMTKDEFKKSKFYIINKLIPWLK